MVDRLRDLLRRVRRGRHGDGSTRLESGGQRTDAMVVGENLAGEVHNPDAPATAPVNWVRPVDEGRPRT